MIKYLYLSMMFVTLVIFSGPASAEFAACTPTSSYTITAYALNDTASLVLNGDLTATFSTGVTGCEAGAWIRSTDPGYNAVLSVMTAARVANKSVTFTVDTTKLWSATAAHICLITAVSMNP